MIDWKIFLTIAAAAISLIVVMALIVVAKERFFAKRSAAVPTTTNSSDRDWPWLVIIGIVAIPLGIAELIVFLSFNYTWTLPFVGNLRMPFLFLGLALVYLGFCLRTVKEDEYGVISVLGRMMKTVDSGLVFVPLWVARLLPFPTQQKTIEMGSGEATPPEAGTTSHIIQCPKEIMVTFGDCEELKTTPFPDGLPLWEGMKDATEPLNRRVRASIKVMIVVRIARDAVQQFVKQVGSFENGIAQLEKNARGVVDDVCTKMTWAYFNHNQREVAEWLLVSLEAFVGDPNPHKHDHAAYKKAVTDKTMPWGLDIISVAVQPSAFAESVQTAFDSVAQARQTKIATITAAEGARKKLEEEGAGNASATRAMRIAEADGVAAMNREVGTEAGKFNRAMQAAEAMAQNGNVIFSGENPVAVAAAQIKAVVDAYKPPTQPKKGVTP